MHLNRRQIALISLTVFLLSAVPVAAHADLLSGAASLFGVDLHDSLGSAFVKIVVGVLTSVEHAFVSAITYLSAGLTWAIHLRPDGGGPVIYGAWRILRDMANMGFIIAIILTSFGTVFNALPIKALKPYTVYNKELLVGFFAAAILMNFSLAIGQSIVAISDQVSDGILAVLPQNIGEEIGIRLNAAALLDNKGPKIGSTADISNQTNAPSDIAATVPNDTLKRQQDAVWEQQFLSKYLYCAQQNGGLLNNTLNRLVGSSTQANCYSTTAASMKKLPYPDVATASQTRYNSATGDPPQLTQVGGLLYTGIGGQTVLAQDYANAQAAVAVRPVTDLSADAAKIPSILYSIFLYAVIALSFLVVIIFMLIRIPILWVILAFSPVAWIGLVFPNTKWWDDWWRQFMAWNIFSPAYLLLIYVGMYMLGQQGTLLAQLSKNGGPLDVQIGALIFYIMTGIIFVVGSGMVFELSFKGGSIAKNVAGSIQSSLGIKGQYGAVGAIYRGSGLQAEVQAGRERVQQAGRDIGAAARGRFPGIVGTNEEALAAARGRFGVRGAGKEIADLQQKRITEQQEIIKARNLDEAGLRRILSSANRDAALAAGEMLLAKNKLTAEEMKRLSNQYAGISENAQKSFSERVSKNLDEKLREKKFEDPAEVIASLELLKGGQRDKFLKNLERSQPLIAAQLADKFYFGADGKTKARSNEVLERNVSAIDNDAWAKIVGDDNITMTPALEQALRERTQKVTNYMEMVRRATPTQQEKIAGITRRPYTDVEKAHGAAIKEEKKRNS